MRDDNARTTGKNKSALNFTARVAEKPVLCWACPVEVGLSAHVVVDCGIITLGDAPWLAFILAVPVAKDDIFRAEVAVAVRPVKLSLLMLATLRLL
jgi:hypothetical protein